MGILNDTLKNAKTILRAAEDDARVQNDGVRVAERAVETARKHGYKTLAANEKALDHAMGRASEAGNLVELAKQQVGAAERALFEARAQRYVERTQAARDLIGVTDTSDLMLKCESRGSREAFVSSRWEVSLLQLDESSARITKTYMNREGEIIAYPEQRFGYGTTVYGPEENWRGKWEEARINWGTLGALRIADARDMLRVHSAAITLAAWLEEQREAWVAEDAAD